MDLTRLPITGSLHCGHDSKGIAVLLFCLWRLPAPPNALEAQKGIYDLVEVCERKEKPNDEIKNNDWSDTSLLNYCGILIPSSYQQRKPKLKKLPTTKVKLTKVLV